MEVKFEGSRGRSERREEGEREGQRVVTWSRERPAAAPKPPTPANTSPPRMSAVLMGGREP